MIYSDLYLSVVLHRACNIYSRVMEWLQVINYGCYIVVAEQLQMVLGVHALFERMAVIIVPPFLMLPCRIVSSTPQGTFCCPYYGLFILLCAPPFLRDLLQRVCHLRPLVPPFFHVSPFFPSIAFLFFSSSGQMAGPRKRGCQRGILKGRDQRTPLSTQSACSIKDCRPGGIMVYIGYRGFIPPVVGVLHP